MVELKREFVSAAVELTLTLVDRTTARFDEDKITRVLHNLVRNAVEAMGKRGGKINIRVTEQAATKASSRADLVIAVSDTGPGIPKEIESKLFQSFVSAGKKGGTGLGLAIVKKIVEEHRGSIAVHSTSRGTTFTLVLPEGDSKA